MFAKSVSTTQTKCKALKRPVFKEISNINVSLQLWLKRVLYDE